MSTVVTPRTSPWIDLVFHTLSFLPVDPTDASSLYDERYVDWANAHLPAPDDARRTLVADAEHIAAVYDATRGAHRLHGYVRLHRDLDDFLHTAARELSQLSWPDASTTAEAQALQSEVPEVLLELFRIALWGEVQAGYPALRERQLESAYTHATGTFAEALAALTGLPEVHQVDWWLSHPLRRAGRLLQSGGDARPQIVVGIPDEALDVPIWAPLIQGVHELLLSRVCALMPDGDEDRGTRAGQEGWAAFFGPELVALCWGARLLRRGVTAATFPEWLRTYYPQGVEDLLPQLDAAGFQPKRMPTRDHRNITTLIDLLATGDALDPALVPIFEQALG